MIYGWCKGDGNIYGNISNLHVHSALQILTLTLLWQAISFQCTVLKRSRSDTLLDKDSAIATISSAWESRRTGVASCSCLICKSYPLLDEITRSQNWCPRQDLGADADRFQTLQAASSRNIRGKRQLLMAPKTSRSIATAQNMHNLLPFSEEHPQSKALPWSRANNENHSRINCCQPHICRLEGSSPLCLNYIQIWTHQISDWIWLGFVGYHYWLQRLARSSTSCQNQQGFGLQPTWCFASLVGGFNPFELVKLDHLPR